MESFHQSVQQAVAGSPPTAASPTPTPTPTPSDASTADDAGADSGSPAAAPPHDADAVAAPPVEPTTAPATLAAEPPPAPRQEAMIECVALYDMDASIFSNKASGAPNAEGDQKQWQPPIDQRPANWHSREEGAAPSMNQWFGRPLTGRFVKSVPELPMGKDDEFSYLGNTHIFAFPQGLHITSEIPEHPQVHSWVWTNYWADGKDMPRVYYHCATIWRPLAPEKLSTIKLYEGAYMIANVHTAEEEGGGGAGPGTGNRADNAKDDSPTMADLDLPQQLYEPQVLCIVTKLPYHQSFVTLLERFAAPLSQRLLDNNEGVQNRDLDQLFELLNLPVRPVGEPPLLVSLHDTLFALPSNEAADWEVEYGARCLEADMRPLFTYLQPSNLTRLFSAVLLERSVLLMTSKPDILFSCLETLRAIIFPLAWFQLYIPTMPIALAEELQVPMTYLVGAAKTEEVIDNIKLENSVVVDLDLDVVNDAYSYLEQQVGVDMAHDWRGEYFHSERGSGVCFPPRYAIKLHKEINRYAPLFGLAFPDRPLTTVDLPEETEESVRRLAERHAGTDQAPAAHDASHGFGHSSLTSPHGATGSNATGGSNWLLSRSRRTSHMADLTLHAWGALESSEEEASDEEEFLAAESSHEGHSDRSDGSVGQPPATSPRQGFCPFQAATSFVSSSRASSTHPSNSTFRGSSGPGLPTDVPSGVPERTTSTGRSLGYPNHPSFSSSYTSTASSSSLHSRPTGGPAGQGRGSPTGADGEPSPAPPSTNPRLGHGNGSALSSGSSVSSGTSFRRVDSGGTDGGGLKSWRGRRGRGGQEGLNGRALRFGRVSSSDAEMGGDGGGGGHDQGSKGSTRPVSARLPATRMSKLWGSGSNDAPPEAPPPHVPPPQQPNQLGPDDPHTGRPTRSGPVPTGGGGGAAEDAAGAGVRASGDEGQLGEDGYSDRWRSGRSISWNGTATPLEELTTSARTRPSSNADVSQVNSQPNNSKFFSLRRAFFAVLCSLLKSYRQYIKTPPPAGAGSGHHQHKIVKLEQVFDLEAFVLAREAANPQCKSFLEQFLRQPIFENYMHSRIASTNFDALDRTIYETQRRRAWEAGMRTVRNQRLGFAFKAKVGTHEHSLFGPRSWTHRLFELEHQTTQTQPHGVGAAAGEVEGDCEGGCHEELVDLIYYQEMEDLEALEAKIEQAKRREKSTRDLEGKLRALTEELERELAEKKAAARRGSFQLLKGRTTIVFPKTHRSYYRTGYAFEIHAHHGKKTKIMTICCEQSKDRFLFIKEIRRALYRKADVDRMRDQYLSKDDIRAFHSAMEQARRDLTTKHILEQYPAPFLAKHGPDSAVGGVRHRVRRSSGPPSMGVPLAVLKHATSAPGLFNMDGGERMSCAPSFSHVSDRHHLADCSNSTTLASPPSLIEEDELAAAAAGGGMLRAEPTPDAPDHPPDPHATTSERASSGDAGVGGGGGDRAGSSDGSDMGNFGSSRKVVGWGAPAQPFSDGGPSSSTASASSSPSRGVAGAAGPRGSGSNMAGERVSLERASDPGLMDTRGPFPTSPSMGFMVRRLSTQFRNKVVGSLGESTHSDQSFATAAYAGSRTSLRTSESDPGTWAQAGRSEGAVPADDASGCVIS